MNQMFSMRSKINRVLQTYAARMQAFRRNARMYLIYMIIFGVGMGVFRLLFNFYILSQGYNEALLGTLITISNMTALIVALPVGYLIDRLGSQQALMISISLFAGSVLVMVIFPLRGLLLLMNVTLGLAQSLSSITSGPFLMDNSGEEERTTLFSFSFGLRMTAMFVGNWVGGYLPGWLGAWRGVDAASSAAYGWALGIIALVILLGLLPIAAMHRPKDGEETEEKSLFLPLTYLRDHFYTFGKLILPMLVTSFGAGLFMPFMNIFFRTVHLQSDQQIGTLFAWGSLAMGIGLMSAPVFADRFGKIQLVVFTQAVSVPFLILLGFSPWFGLSLLGYYVRLVLMNMSNPVYQIFVMERVEPKARATAASLLSMAWASGRAFSPTISGWLQVEYGFNPVFVCVVLLYSAAVFLYWWFFLRQSDTEST